MQLVLSKWHYRIQLLMDSCAVMLLCMSTALESAARTADPKGVWCTQADISASCLQLLACSLGHMHRGGVAAELTGVKRSSPVAKPGR